MDKYTATELAFKHGYEKGYEAGYADCLADQKWIPVSERLPEEDGEYLTMTNATGKNRGVMSQRFRTAIVKGKTLRRWYWLERLSPWVVTHWRPLPEPPKEGE